MSLPLLALGIVAILAGLAGVAVPALPGMPLIVAGAVLVGWADGFARVGVFVLVLIAILGVVGWLADVAASMLGARRAGASGWGLAGAMIGLLAGLPFGIVGIVLGPAIGAVTLEYFRDRDVKRAATAGGGVVLGFLVGTAIKYAVAFAMIGLLVAAWFV